MGGNIMTTKDISCARSAELRASVIAMQRAANMAREIAIQTNTAIIVHKDGKPIRITAEQLRTRQNENASQQAPLGDE